MSRLELLRCATTLSALLARMASKDGGKARVTVSREDLCDAASYAESLKDALECDDFEIAEIVTELGLPDARSPNL